MDVVRRNILDLGGVIDVDSVPGAGTTFTIRLPLTLAMLEGQLVRVGADTYVVPMLSVVESLVAVRDRFAELPGGGLVYRYRDEALPVVTIGIADPMHPALSHAVAPTEHEPVSTGLASREPAQRVGGRAGSEGLLVIVDSARERLALVVDDVQGQQQVVVKSLERNLARVAGVSGATILGDGTIALIVDVASLDTPVFLSGSGDPGVAHAA